MTDVTDKATGKPRILAEKCATCIMRAPSDGQIHLGAERLREFIADTRRRESYVVCHSTIHTGLTDERPAICRGFADAYSTNHLRIMRRLGGFVEVPAP